MRCSGEQLERLDLRLAAFAREEAALRLRLGQVLEVLGRGAVFDLGFSSLAAHAVERCERSVRWVECARCLARSVEELPALRQGLAFGKVSWSMGELLARVATRDDEARWLELAERRTVRQIRVLVAEESREWHACRRVPGRPGCGGVDRHGTARRRLVQRARSARPRPR